MSQTNHTQSNLKCCRINCSNYFPDGCHRPTLENVGQVRMMKLSTCELTFFALMTNVLVWSSGAMSQLR